MVCGLSTLAEAMIRDTIWSQTMASTTRQELLVSPAALSTSTTEGGITSRAASCVVGKGGNAFATLQSKLE